MARLLLVAVAAFVFTAPSARAQFVNAAPDNPLYDAGGPHQSDPGQWNLRKIRMPEAWGITTGSDEIVVAMIDLPIDLTLPDLDGTLWENPDEVPGNNVDDDENDLIDDIHGWSFATSQPVSPGPFSHGAPVAGIALAETDNATDMAGIAGGRLGIPGVRLMVLTWQLTSTRDQELADALDYAREKGADVVNMSFSASGPAFTAAGARATADGMVLIAASGNGDSTSDDFSPNNPVFDDPANVGQCPSLGTFPGSDPDVLSVGATLIGGQRWAGSCPFGNGSVSRSVMAPGGDDIPTLASDGGTVPSFGGTSAAAPHVAGVAALLLSVHPALTRDQVYDAIVSTANLSGCIEIDPALSYGRECGSGRLDAYAALHYVLEHYGGPQQDMTLSEDLTVPMGETWDLGDISLRFANGARLRVLGTLNADGTTFTNDGGEGWGGIDFQPGSSGTLQNATTRLAGNAATGGAAGVRAYDATVSIVGGSIADGLSTASGVRVIGSQGYITVDGTLIERMPHDGILATGFGTVKVFNATIQQNLASGITATTGAMVHVGSPTTGARSAMVNDLTGNAHRGILAASGATVTHAKASAVGQRGYNYVVGNQQGGIATQTGALQNAGSSNAYASYNWIAGNQGFNAVSRTTGTVTNARYDWWGTPSAPPDTFAYHGTSQQAYLGFLPRLTAPPAAAPGAAPLTAPPPEPAAVPGNVFTDAEALALRGRGREGVALLTETIAGRPGSTDAATALSMAGAFAADEEGDEASRASALALLHRESRSRRADHRAWARRGLVRAYGRAGDYRRMMTEAQAMLGDDPDAVSAFIAHLVLAYGYASVGKADLAWEAWEAAAVLGTSREVAEEISVEAARSDLVALVGAHPGSTRSAAVLAQSSVVDATSEAGLLAPYPNPAGAGMVTVPYVLAESGPVRLTLVDVIGREVVVLVDGVQETGAHLVRLDTDRLALGVYAIRFQSGEAAPESRVLTIAR